MATEYTKMIKGFWEAGGTYPAKINKLTQARNPPPSPVLEVEFEVANYMPCVFPSRLCSANSHY